MPNPQIFKTSFFLILFLSILQLSKAQDIPAGSYNKVVEGFDWGAAVSKVIIPLEESTDGINPGEYRVNATRRSRCFATGTSSLQGDRLILGGYVSDTRGNRLANGNHATLILAVGPDLSIGSPMQYFWGTCQGTQWVYYSLEVTHPATGKSWNREHQQVSPIVDQFDLTGSYTHENRQPLTYAAYTPIKKTAEKSPLIIWLHGGGEGGTDTTIPLLANKATNYASEGIQSLFGGAFVLVPQCQGAWMHNKKGVSTWGKENDIYNESLMALIRDYVNRHPEIDQDRIYVGGCSNGGYMSLKLMLLYPDYFAAAYISALAYQSKFLSDQELRSIAHKPIWFVHSADDQVTPPRETAVPVYDRLIKAGAKDVHLSLYDHVIDLYGTYGGAHYRYNGHLSWIYVHANHAAKFMDGAHLTIMEWMASKKLN